MLLTRYHARLAGACFAAIGLACASARPARADTFIGCGFRGESQVTARPHYSFLGWPDLPLAAAIGLQRIRWHSWGGDMAPGRAVWRTKNYDPWSHVRILAYRRRSCGHGSLYTSVRVTGTDYDGQRWSRSWRTMHCSDLPVDR